VEIKFKYNKGEEISMVLTKNQILNKTLVQVVAQRKRRQDEKMREAMGIPSNPNAKFDEQNKMNERKFPVLRESNDSRNPNFILYPELIQKEMLEELKKIRALLEEMKE
jgi:hypothetical protein